MKLRGSKYLLPANLKERYLVIWWYGRLEEGSDQNKQPYVLVQTREIDIDKGKLGSFHIIKLLLSHSGMAPIGSIWKIKDADLIYSTRLYIDNEMYKFSVDFSENKYFLYSLRDVEMIDLLPGDYYPILNLYDDKYIGKRPRSEVLCFFDSVQQKHVIVPCIEFFNKFYGHKSEFRHKLLVNSVQENFRHHFEFTSRNPIRNYSDEWLLYIRKEIDKRDVPFLAHLKFTERAQRVTKHLHSQLQYLPERKRLFLKVEPWSEGKTEISGYGIDIPETNCFLMLNVKYSELSGFPDILYQRENTNLSGNMGDDVKDRVAYDGAFYHSEQGENDILDEDLRPEHHSGTIRIKEESFRLNFQALLRRVDLGKITSLSGDKINIESYGLLGTGRREGVGNQVSNTLIEKDDDIEELSSEGKVKDMWFAFRHLLDVHDVVESVEYYNQNEKRFVSDQFFKFVRFSKKNLKLKTIEYWQDTLVQGKQRKNTIKQKSMINWLYHRRLKSKRGFLVMKITLINSVFYIVETERIIKVNGQEESLSGLGFQLPDNISMKAVLPSIIKRIVQFKGLGKYAKQYIKEDGDVINVFDFHHGHATDAQKYDYICEPTARRIIDDYVLKFR